MADVVDKETRSRMMSGITGKNTKPELQVRKALHGMGYRYRLHVRNLPGTPDIVLPKFRSAIFVNGCFWHGHDCHLFKIPGTRTKFWRDKIAGTRARDISKRAALLDCSWRVATVWECALKGRTKLGIQDVVDQIARWLSSNSSGLEIRGTG